MSETPTVSFFSPGAAGLEWEASRPQPVKNIVAAMSAELWRAAPVGPLLSSFSINALEAAAAAAPDLARGLLVEAIPDDWRDTLARLGCVSLHCSVRHLTKAQVRSVRDGGFGLLCYTVNDPATARELFDWGVDTVVTDRIDLLPPGLLAQA